MVLVPVHLIAFAALYLATTATVRKEILNTHATDARMLVDQAIGDLPPYMAFHLDDPTSQPFRQWSEAHDLMDLQVFGPQGTPVGGPDVGDPAVRSFLRGTEDDRFSFVDQSDSTILKGLVRIRATNRCVPCHTAGDVLGAAEMSLDLTEPVALARNRVQRNLAILVIGWGVIVGLVNVGLGHWARRSLSRLDGNAATTHAPPPPQALSRVPEFPVDSVSAEIYASLRQLLKQKALRDREVDERLQHHQRLASLGQLAAGLAQQIKNPLSGINGVLELLRDDADDDGQRDLYERMLSELDRVNGTILSLLSFSRPAAVSKVPTDVGALLESSVQLQRPALVAKNISIRITVAPRTPEVRVDQNQLRQAVVNLVTNAADAIGRSGTIGLTAAPLPEYDGVAIAVTDDGPGIPDEHRAHVIEPFFTTKFTGTGLGLAVVRNIVGAHGGRLEIDSKVGSGTCVYIVLPTNEVFLDAASGA